MGRGGKRPGAGRPRKSAEEKALGGWAGHRTNATTRKKAVAQARAAKKKRSGPKPIDLTPEHASVWAELAPFATAQGTLTDASVMAFRDLCEAIVIKRALLRQITAEGWTVIGPSGISRAHPLLTRYQGIYQRIEAGLTRFALSPMGEEMGFGKPPAGSGVGATAPEERDPFAEFDGPTH